MSTLRYLSAPDICEHEGRWAVRWAPDPNPYLRESYYLVRTQTCLDCGEVWQMRVLSRGTRLVPEAGLEPAQPKG